MAKVPILTSLHTVYIPNLYSYMNIHSDYLSEAGSDGSKSLYLHRADHGAQSEHGG